VLSGAGVCIRTLSYREPDAAIEALAERFGRAPAAVVEILRALQANHARLTSERIVAGTETAQDFERLSELARLHTMSLCGLGISAANPIRSARTHFRDELGSA
jgi:transposase-like protein